MVSEIERLRQEAGEPRDWVRRQEMRDAEKLYFTREEVLTLAEKGHGRVKGEYRVMARDGRVGERRSLSLWPGTSSKKKMMKRTKR